jgi:hypothetical protein
LPSSALVRLQLNCHSTCTASPAAHHTTHLQRVFVACFRNDHHWQRGCEPLLWLQTHRTAMWRQCCPADVVAHFQSALGITFQSLSPFNEPASPAWCLMANCTQEACFFTRRLAQKVGSCSYCHSCSCPLTPPPQIKYPLVARWGFLGLVYGTSYWYGIC